MIGYILLAAIPISIVILILLTLSRFRRKNLYGIRLNGIRFQSKTQPLPKGCLRASKIILTTLTEHFGEEKAFDLCYRLIIRFEGEKVPIRGDALPTGFFPDGSRRTGTSKIIRALPIFAKKYYLIRLSIEGEGVLATALFHEISHHVLSHVEKKEWNYNHNHPSYFTLEDVMSGRMKL